MVLPSPNSHVLNLPSYAFDHSPLILNTDKTTTYRCHAFRFQNMWLEHPDINLIINKAWTNEVVGLLALRLVNKLNNTRK